MTKTAKHSAFISAGIAGMLGMLVTACNQQQVTASVTDKPKIDSVKVFVLTVDSAKKSIMLPGELIAFEHAEVRSKIQGYVRRLSADIGSRVSRGQVLALIDAPEINTRLLELNEKIKAADARYRSSKDYYDRLSLASHSDGVIAPLELQKARNQLLADSSEHNAAMLAARSYRQVGNYLAVVAPYSGIITKRNIVEGSFVGNPSDKPLFELENNTTLRLQVAVPEIYTNAVLLNNTGDLTTRSMPDKKIKAALVRKSGSIATETRSEVWEFAVPNPAGELRAGSYADVKLVFARKGVSLIVPVSAIVTTQERKFVIRASGGATQWVDVRTGFNLGDRQEIFGELSPGDTVVTKPTEELKAGTKIAIKL
ncbi:efflux RND transporter periplasmic adaptor subunit [Sediminibacterium soli]|uniref:efflux RND transporter periplasmic adaptor subunit n=1 Tax=Sediminibacterium soli TaxID=2698829 RepID=UPI00137B42BC|nr:efflux RND transporter periplasmic adaptor subunit [Sediminibacterium soli]NCI45050.1 efflux RND transporter periplasmic adaptor subunit [Sediminibacterium soli]